MTSRFRMGVIPEEVDDRQADRIPRRGDHIRFGLVKSLGVSIHHVSLLMSMLLITHIVAYRTDRDKPFLELFFRIFTSMPCDPLNGLQEFCTQAAIPNRCLCRAGAEECRQTTEYDRAAPGPITPARR